MLIDYPDLHCTNVIEYTWSDFIYDATNDTSLAYYEYYDFSTAVAALAGSDRSANSTSVIFNTFGNVLFDLSIQIYVDSKKEKEDGKDGWSSAYFSASVSFVSRSCSGCYLDYPSEAAMESNYVDRVRVFGLIQPSLANRSASYSVIDTNYLESVNKFTGSSIQPWFYESFNYGASLFNYPCSRNDGVSSFPANGMDALYYTFGTTDTIRYRLTPLLDVTDPSSLDDIKFSLGASAGSYNIDLSSKSDYSVDEFAYVDNFYAPEFDSYSYGKYKHANEIKIIGYIVVVDWDWDHCNPDSDFSPELNTPEWVE